MDDLSLTPIRGLPEVQPGTDLASLLSEVAGPQLQPGDILVVTHKIVSKAEGSVVDLTQVEPGELACRWARQWNKDARQIEVVLQQSQSVLRMERGIIISRTRHGLVCANAGVDRSNSPGETVCLLPEDPDRSAHRLFVALQERLGFAVPILISDSFGRPWRIGIVNIAIGVAGMEPFTDHRGDTDEHGYLLEASIMATADALCAAAELAMGKKDAVPVVRVRGCAYRPASGGAQALIRPTHEDMFR